MESDLFKQLEDKKKGCGSLFIDENGNDAPCKLLLVDRVEPEPHFCPTCKSNIAILEQAIAEIKKQRQEILRLLKVDLLGNECRCDDCIKVAIDKQLNQPKEEGKA